MRRNKTFGCAQGVRVVLALVFAVFALPAFGAATSLDSLNKTNWRTFAKPLPLGHDEMLLFERDGATAVGWRIRWSQGKAERFALPWLRLEDKRRYSAAATTKGLWLVGAGVLLVQPDGRVLQQPLDYEEPVVVGLSDGSVLVLGNAKEEVGRALRIAVDKAGTRLLVEDKGALPGAGVTAVALRNGSVLLLGGPRSASYAATLDPLTGRVQPIAPMPRARSFAAAQLLPDGRVAVGGAEFLRCHDPSAREVDLYDPGANTWISLPPLPLPLCSEAYGADRPSMAVAQDGALMLGGHLETHLMTLSIDRRSATGYAASWKQMGVLPQRRIGGVVQVLSNGDVGVAGGVHPRVDAGCCWATPGVDRISSSDDPAYRSFGLDMTSPAVARRGQRVFVALGWQFTSTSTGQMRYSSAAELIDLATGKVTQLPQVPFASGAGDALWLDEDRVLLKGHTARSFSGGQDPASYMPQSSGGLAIYSVARGSWTKLDVPVLQDSRVAGARDGRLLFVSPDVVLRRMTTADMKVTELSGAATRERRGGSVRWLADGRFVLAGGYAHSDLISLADDGCKESSPALECRERFVGYGALVPAQQHDVFRDKDLSQWSLSSPGTSVGTEAVIEADGSVTRVGMVDAPDGVNAAGQPLKRVRVLIERSDPGGGNWRALPLPAELAEPTPQLSGPCQNPVDCRLMLAPDPRNPARELLFLGAGDFAGDRLANSTAMVRVWWFDAAANRWHLMLEADPRSARTSPQDLAAPLSDAATRMRSLGWHLPTPVLWTERP